MAGRVRVDCHLHTVASGDASLTLEELAERAPASFLAALADATVTGEFRPHAVRYPRRPPLT
jgi:hypothetical protein